MGFYFREHYFILLAPAAALLAGVAVSTSLTDDVESQKAIEAVVSALFE